MKSTQRQKKSVLKVMLACLAFVLAVFLALSLGACTHGNRDGGEDTEPEAITALPEDTATVESGELSLTVVYFRSDQKYDGMDFWVWGQGGGMPESGSSACSFDARPLQLGENTLRWFRVKIKDNGTDDIGCIPRKRGANPDGWGSGSAKDVEADRIVPYDWAKDGRITVYFASGVTTPYKTAQDAIDAALSKKFKSVIFSSFNKVSFSSDSAITEKSVFKVKDGDGNILATLVSKGTSLIGKYKGSITLPEDIDLAKKYTLVDEPETFDKLSNFLPMDIVKNNLYHSDDFNALYQYDGELGAIYTADKTTFKVWSPLATAMKLNIYSAGEGGEAESVDMTKGEKGVWSVEKSGDLNGKYYTYSVTLDGKTTEVVDPYARSAGRDGKRGMILDLDATNPVGWDDQNDPTIGTPDPNDPNKAHVDGYSQSVIYEAQLRDLTINPNSGVSEANRGKFLGLTESGTKITVGDKDYSTALDYLEELGVTAVHFQPLFDFASVNESFNQATYNKDGEYNWGYDPLNYNVPEGSYSSDPADGAKRVNEMKQMVMALHNKGIQVIMDVVYNHVSNMNTSNFEALFPGYYFRVGDDGVAYNGSGCGNETASENAMFRKFMIDSVTYWQKEYKIDGFRFDLMGLHDIDTMNAIYKALSDTNPDVMVYGEGWTGGTSGLSQSKAAIQKNASKMPNIAVFNDIIRDGLKGSVFDMKDTGFVSGKKTDAAVYVGAAGATDALDSDIYGTISKSSFAKNPTQSINYVSAHDNSTLWDKLNASVKADNETLKAMNRLAAVSVLTSQGPSFFLAGEEMLRGKPTTKDNAYDNRPNVYKTDANHYFSDNSYKSPDSVNAIDWSLRAANDDMVEFYKGLIMIKRSSPVFQFTTENELSDCLVMIDTDTKVGLKDGVALYGIKYQGAMMVIALNANSTEATIGLPAGGSYGVFVNGKTVDVDANEQPAPADKKFKLGAYSAAVLAFETVTDADIAAWEYDVTVAAPAAA